MHTIKFLSLNSGALLLKHFNVVLSQNYYCEAEA